MEVIEILIIILAAIPVGIFAGSSAVYVFNHVPAAWLCDYGQEPSQEVISKDRQRLPGHPWKWAFSCGFICIIVLICTNSYVYILPVLAQLWLLLLIAVADKKYMIIPDQFVVLLAVFAIGFIPMHETVGDMVFGALAGGGVLLVMALAGRLFTGRQVMGFGDIKLMAAIGLTLGLQGTLIVLASASVLGGTVCAVQLLRKRVKLDDTWPLGPYISFAAALYLVLSLSL